MLFNTAKTTLSEDPIKSVADMLRESGNPAFQDPGIWEYALCGLILALDPRCKSYRLVEALPCGRQKYDLADVLGAVSNLGYFSRQEKVPAEEIDERLFPVLYITDENEPLILAQADADGVRLVRNGDIIYYRREQLADFQGSAVFFARYDENKTSLSKFMREGLDHSWFRALIGRFRTSFTQILAAGLFINLLSLMPPITIMLVYDRVISTGTLSILPMIMVGVAMGIFFEVLLRAARSGGLSWMAARMDNIVGNRIFAHLIGLAPSLIERASVSAQIARIKTFESIRDFFCSSVFLSIIELPFVVFAAIAIYFIAGNLVLVPLAMGVLYAFLFLVIYRGVRKSIRLAAKASSARQQLTIETFEKVGGLRTYGLTGLWGEKFRDLSGKEMMAHFHLGFLGMAGETLGGMLTVLSAVAVIAFGTAMVWDGVLNTGALVATMILSWRVITPFYNICTMIPRIEQLRYSVLQVNNLMDLETEESESKSLSSLSAIRGDIAFSNVTLSYAKSPDPVLEDISFSVRAGDILMITGENGAGKSSILKLIKGMHRPTSGSVQIDGFDLRQLDPVSLRRQIAYLPQQSTFFEGSILQNLRLSSPLASLQDVEAALTLADADGELSALPAGLETMMGRSSPTCVTAQLKQKLALARLYLHTAPLVLIDELPNILMSGKAGRNLRDYIARAKGKRTFVMVTYREDFLKMADTIMLMRRGDQPVIGENEKIINLVMEAA